MLGKHQRNKIKTLCTIDTSDIDLQDTKLPSEKKIMSQKHCKDKHTQSPCLKRKITHKLKTPSRTYDEKFFRTQNMNTKSPNNNNRSKAKTKSEIHHTIQRSKSRIKTDYSTSSEVLMKTLLGKNRKIKQSYKMDTYEIVQQISQSNKQKIYLVKKLDKAYIMKRTKNSETKKQYQNQANIRGKLLHIKWKNLIKQMQVYSEKNWMYSIYEQYGENLSWTNSSHCQVVEKILKHEGIILKHIIKEVAKGINQLSSKGYVHNNIRFQNICLKIQQFKTTIKIEGNVKISNLGLSFNIKDKNKLMNLASEIYTPPQLINLKLFESGEKFDRELIEYINYYDQAWYIDVWALGVLILQLIAGESISIEKSQPKTIRSDEVSIEIQDQSESKRVNKKNGDKEITLADILQAQKSLLIQTQSQIQKVSFDKKLKGLVLRMLSINPLSRPSPKQIIKEL